MSGPIVQLGTIDAGIGELRTKLGDPALHIPHAIGVDGKEIVRLLRSLDHHREERAKVRMDRHLAVALLVLRRGIVAALHVPAALHEKMGAFCFETDISNA